MMSQRASPLTAAALCALTLASMHASPVQAATPTDGDYATLNRALLTHHVIPRQQALADHTATLAEAARIWCAQPGQQTRATLDTAWHAATDAWQGVQHLRFGPIELYMRAMRMSFWPDPRNNVGRQLDELISANDPAMLTPEHFARSSIAVQGFPALERLLTTAPPGTAVTPARQDPPCAVLQAVTTNIATIAHDTLTEWQQGDRSFAMVVAAAGQPGTHYQNPREATQDFFKSLHTAIELVADHKLARPLGDQLGNARPQLAESWRSQRSLDHIRSNLAAAEALYLGEGGPGFAWLAGEVGDDADLDKLLRRAFAQTRASADSIALPLEHAISDPVARPGVEKLAREAAALKALLVQRLAPAAGIPIGFNALDGD